MALAAVGLEQVLLLLPPLSLLWGVGDKPANCGLAMLLTQLTVRMNRAGCCGLRVLAAGVQVLRMPVVTTSSMRGNHKL
jgi:hypothetical protein